MSISTRISFKPGENLHYGVQSAQQPYAPIYPSMSNASTRRLDLNSLLWGEPQYVVVDQTQQTQTPQPSTHAKPSPAPQSGATSTAESKASPSLWQTVGKSFREVGGSGLSAASGVLDAWSDYVKGANSTFVENKKKEVLESVATDAVRDAQGSQSAAQPGQSLFSPADTSGASQRGQSFVERLASGKERWDSNLKRFVSMVPSMAQTQASDYQQPPEGVICLDLVNAGLQWDSAIQQYRRVQTPALWDPDTELYVPVTEEIAKILTCSNHGLNATGSLDDRVRDVFGSTVSVGSDSSIPLQQYWTQGVVPADQSSQNSFSLQSNQPRPQSQMRQPPYEPNFSYAGHQSWPGLSSSMQSAWSQPQPIPFSQNPQPHRFSSDGSRLHTPPPRSALPRKSAMSRRAMEANLNFESHTAPSGSNLSSRVHFR